MVRAKQLPLTAVPMELLYEANEEKYNKGVNITATPLTGKMVRLCHL